MREGINWRKRKKERKKSETCYKAIQGPADQKKKFGKLFKSVRKKLRRGS